MHLKSMDYQTITFLMRSIVSAALILCVSIQGQSQRLDSVNIFTIAEYTDWVRLYHPVAQRAQLLDERARAELMEARGILDPKVFGDYTDKNFDGKNYFRLGEAGLKVPSWFGVDFKLAYNWTNGAFVDPSLTLPEAGQAVAGLEIPLLQGLLFDARRAQIQKAALIADANEAQRQSLLNNLMMDAVTAYWNWAFRYESSYIYGEALDLARERFTNVRESFFQGDVPAIDTLESLIQVQNREIQLKQARVELQNARLELSNYLWYEDLVPLELDVNNIPEVLDGNKVPESSESVVRFLKEGINDHPDLVSLFVKQEQLDISERLKREMFKPRLNVEYNFLADGWSFNPAPQSDALLAGVLRENYKWGIQFEMPLLFRKERGSLQKIRLDQVENRYKTQFKQTELENKFRMTFQEMQNAFEQKFIAEEMVDNYTRLLDAENEKFRIGESSIFLLNNREQKLIEARLKLTKLQAEYRKLLRKLDWARGQLF